MEGMNYRRFECYFIILFLSPHSHMPSKIGISDFPRSVKLYLILSKPFCFTYYTTFVF